jgi:adenylate kinase family enzyme
MDEANKLYQEIVYQMGLVPRTLMSLLDEAIGEDQPAKLNERLERILESTIYEEKIKIVDEANTAVEKRLRRLGAILEEGPLDVEMANRITRQLNSYTHTVKEVKEFLEDSYMEKIFQRWERTIIKEAIDEYRLKLQAVRSIFTDYNRTAPSKLDVPSPFE